MLRGAWLFLCARCPPTADGWQAALALPALPARCPPGLVPNATRVLRAVLVVDAPDLDLALWDDVLAEEAAADGGEGR